MSKAKAKPKTPTTGGVPNAGAWEASLASTVITDEELRISVHLLSPNKVEDILQMQMLGAAVETNVRQKFVYIDKDALITQGKEQGKSKEGNSRTTFPEVFALLKTGEEPLPSSTIAKLLKVHILEHRDKVLEAREAEIKVQSGVPSKSPAKSVSPNKAKTDKKGGKKSPTKKPGEGAGGIDPEADIARGKCPLKKRGEEKEEPKKIDDYPENGPDMYVLCAGFDQPDFIKECHKTNVPITSLVKVSSEEYSSGGGFLENLNQTSVNLKVVVTDDEAESEILSRIGAHQNLIDTYWAEIEKQVTEVPLPPAFTDVGFEQLTLPKIALDSEIKKDHEKMEEIKLNLYQGVVDKIYSIHTSFCKFQQYNKGMELINVADLTEKNEEGGLVYPLDTRYYDKVMSLLPYESVTPATVLNVIIEQVCQDQLEEKTEIQEERKEPVMKHLGKMVQSLPISLSQQTEFEGFMKLRREKEDTDEQPTVLKDGDDLRINSFHLKPNTYPLNDLNMLSRSICNKMLELPKTTTQILAKIQSLANETETFCGEMSHKNVNKALRQFAFESADLKDIKPGISPLKDTKEYFWDVELLLNAEKSADVSLDKLKAVTIPDLKFNLDHFTYRSFYEKDALLQVLSDAFYEYPYCQRLYHRHEHAMLLVFHAGYNDKRCSESQWKERVHSNIGFHYFMSRTKDKFSDLIGGLPPLTPAPVPSEVTAPPTPITPAAEDVESEPEFQIPANRLEGFKKRSELKEEEKKERAQTGKKGKKSPDKTKSSSRKNSPSPKRKGSPTKSPKRSGPPSRQSSAKSVNKVDFDPVPLVPEPEMDIVLEEGTGRNVFVGFNLPNQIFQAEGTVSHCHPADGSLVRVEKWGHEGSNPRTRVSLLKDGHVMSLNYHLKSDMDLRREKHEAEEKRKADEAAAAEAPSPNGADTASVEAKTPDPEDARSEIPLAKSVTFNMQFKCGMCMSFTKPKPGTKQQPGTKLEVPSDDEEEGSDPPPSVSSPLMSLMTVSLPTGLVIEYCDKDDNEDYHAIRQTYEKKTLLKHKCEQTQAKVCSEEESRLYLSNGCVVKHLNNGKTVILSPDGGYTVKQVPPPIPAITPALTEEPADPAFVTEAEETPKTCIETPPYIAWEVTKCNGEQEHVMSNGETVPLPPLQCYTATDPESKEVMFTRIDSVLSVSRPDGTRIVDHTDGTRITTIDNKDGDTEYKIECVGYATISFHANKSLSSTVFGNGTKIIGEANKTFTIKSQDGSSFQATPHLNRATFTSKPRVEAHMSAADLNTVREKGQLRYSDFGVHQFKLEENVCFEHTDVAGNIFNVTYDGQIATESPDTHVIQHLDHYYKQNKVSGYDEVEREHKPHMRLFMIHSDQTGTEIMDLPKCKAVFDAAATNPDVVKVEEDVENDEFSKAHTFLTPFYQSKGAQWTTEFDEGNIVPNGLVYDGGVKPAAQIMGGWEKRVKSPVIDEPELPPAIHYKQIIEEQPLDDYKRQLVKNGLAAHAKWVVEQELHSQKGSVPDERGEKEKEEAGMLLSRVGVSRPRSGTSVRCLWRSISEQKYKSTFPSSDEEEYYYEDTESVGQTEPEVGLTSEDTPSRMDKRRNTVDSVTRKYSTAVSHNPFKMKMKLKKGIIPQAKWDEIMTEKMEMKMLRSDLRNFRVPNYFDSKFGQAFLASLKDGPDMSSLSDRVPAADISAVTSEKSLDNGPKGESLSTSMILIDGADNMGSNISLTNVGTTPRPGNPTPNVATSGKNELKVSDPKSTPKRASPARDTPLSPHREIPSPNLAKTNNITTPEHDLTSTNFGQSKPNSGTVKSLHIDAKGDIRKTKVMIPRSICGYKPGAEPNTQFLAKEEAVRRGVKTSSVLAAGRRKKIQDMRGFQLYPPEVTFGVLCPNGMYATTVTLKNVGIDSCRFHIKCPKNLLGVTVALHTETNFVAAGMSVKFDVCLSAPNVTEITHVSLDIDIIMEMEVFHLPVLATVLPTEEYDKRSRSGRLTRLPQNIKIIDVSSVVRSNSSAQSTRTLFKQKLVT